MQGAARIPIAIPADRRVELPSSTGGSPPSCWTSSITVATANTGSTSSATG